jgi:Ran GTPase-activating protein (RanGAP) involved in mRNA processing and transport
MMALEDFWTHIDMATSQADEEPEEPLLVEADPLESEPESDEDDRMHSGVFSPEFAESTGVHVYIAACERLGIIPVQQFIAMMGGESVSLKHRGVGAVGGVALFECLRVNRCIRSLDIQDNQLGLGVDADAGGLDHIAEALEENSLLTLIDLSHNNLSSRGCAALSRALAANTSIAELSLRGNSMGDLGAQAFAQALAGNKSITKLDVSDNGIDELGGVALAALLAGCDQLRFVDLSWNSIRLAGADAVTDALRTSKVVRLNLAWNGLGDRGARSLASALADNAELQFLDISKNNLREEAAEHIAGALRSNQTLRSLHLNGNPLNERGVGLLVQAIGANCTVRDVGLHGVGLERSGVGLFDPLNPTGRFSLDLAAPFDRAVFEAHKELDLQDEASGIDNFLSVRHNGKHLLFEEDGASIQEWPTPAEGTLTYDYVSGKRVPREARAQRDAVFESFKHDMAHAHSSDFERLVHLRMACITHFFTCEQARQLLLLFTYTQRADASVVLFRRCVDPQHFELIWKVLSGAERADLRARLDEALKPYLPEEERVRVFLTEMDASALAAANPLEVEFEKAWQRLLPFLRHSLGERGSSASGADSGETDAQCDALRAVLSAEYARLRAVFQFYSLGEEERARALDPARDAQAADLKLSGKELWHFCQACELPSEQMPLGAIDAIFMSPMDQHKLDEVGAHAPRRKQAASRGSRRISIAEAEGTRGALPRRMLICRARLVPLAPLLPARRPPMCLPCPTGCSG